MNIAAGSSTENLSLQDTSAHSRFWLLQNRPIRTGIDSPIVCYALAGRKDAAS